MKAWQEVLKNRSFLAIWIATGFSSFADASYFILLTWFVIRQTGSSLMVGTLLATAAIPRLIFSVLGGVLADRMSKKKILMYSLFLRAVVLALFTLYILTQFHYVWPVYILAFLFGFIDSFYFSASSAMVPSVVEASVLARANSLVQTTQQLSMIGGPLLAALLLWLAPAAGQFSLLILLYVLSWLALFTMRWHTEATDTELKKTPLHDLWDGMRYISRVPSMLSLMAFTLIANFLFVGPVNVGLALLVHERLWLGSQFGELNAGFGMGGLLGGLLFGLLNGMRGRFTWLGGFMLIASAMIIVVGALPVYWIDLIAMFVLGMTLMLIDGPMMTYFQTIVEKRYLGRVMSLIFTSSLGMQPLSYALLGYALHTHLLTSSASLIGAGFLLMLLGIFWWLSPAFRNLEKNPAWEIKPIKAEQNQTTRG